MSLIKSIATVSGCTAISRVVGFVRDILMARFLGASMMADAFFVAWRFPNLFRSLFAEGTLNVAFVPLFTGYLNQKGKTKALEFAQSVFYFLLYTLLIFTIIIEIIMPNMMFLLAPGFDKIPGKLALATSLSRISFPFLLFVSLVSLLSGMLNSIGKFWAAAFSPVLLNLTMIFSLLCFTPFISNGSAPAYALAIGVTMAGVFELLFLLWHIQKSGLLFKVISPLQVFKNLSQDVVILLKKMAPGVLGSGVYQINLFFDTLFVSFVGAGAISWLNYAHHVFQLPIGIIGVAIGTALLPVLSKYVKMGQIEQANAHLNRGLEISLMMSLPATVGLFLLSFPIIQSLFQYGVFTSQDTLHTARALSIFSMGLPAYMATKTFAPFFYARGDTTTPVKIAIIGVVLNTSLALLFMQFWGYAGIALATTCSVWINALQYLFRLIHHPEFSFDTIFRFRFFRLLFSVLIMGIGIYLMTLLQAHFLVNISQIMQILLLGFIIFVSGSIYLSTLCLTHTIDLKEMIQLIKKKMGRK